MKFTVDTREPWPHPWAPFFSPDVTLARGTMDTGDMAVSALPDGAVVERKAPGDFLAAIGRERERFERELLRSRYLGAFVIIVEASLADLLALNRQHGGGIHEAAIVGSVAAWTRRGAPVLFCGDVRLAAETAERFLRGQVREVQRTTAALARADRTALPSVSRPTAPPCPPARPAVTTPVPRHKRPLAAR